MGYTRPESKHYILQVQDRDTRHCHSGRVHDGRWYTPTKERGREALIVLSGCAPRRTVYLFLTIYGCSTLLVVPSVNLRCKQEFKEDLLRGERHNLAREAAQARQGRAHLTPD